MSYEKPNHQSNNIKESGVDRVVGVEPKTEQELLNFFKNRMARENLREYEQEMTPEMKSLIPRLNERLNEFVAEYGGKTLKIPEQAVHFLDPEKLPDEGFENMRELSKKEEGTWFDTFQKILIHHPFVEGSKLRLSRTLVHEMLHANSFSSFQKIEEEDKNSMDIELNKDSGESMVLGPRRSGVGIIRPDRTGFFFDWNEAIIEELTIRFDKKYFKDLPEIHEEYDKREWAIQEYSKNHGIDPEEARRKLAHAEFKKQPDGVTDYTFYGPSYRPEREKLYAMLEEIQKANSDEFKSADDVFEVFARAQLSGQLLPLARLIEKTYGKGSFRKLGEETSKANQHEKK